MQSRLARSVLLALLMIAGGAAAYVVWNTEVRIAALEERRLAVDRVIDRLTPAVMAIAGAQNAYVDYGLKDEPTLARVGEIVDQVTTDAALLRSGDPTGEAADRLEKFWSALSSVTAARAQAGELLARGETWSAADLLLASTRTEVIALAAELRAFRAAELTGLRADRTALTRRSWVTLAAVSILWIAGLTALVFPPPQANPAAGVEPLSAQPAVAAPSVDLAATSALCADIVRLTDGDALPKILARASVILDARGIIVWMAAGDALFAATAFGYEPAVVSRLLPIPRTAENATAATWRSGQPGVVMSDDSTLGAVVAPMLGPDRCMGVLAAEVRNGREKDAATRAVTAILASQLAGVLTAWPASSTVATGPVSQESNQPAGSNRQSAAS
jgi:hypothetical protein